MGNAELSVVMLTDEAREHALTVICDEPMTRQYLLRLQHSSICSDRLPEALVQMLTVGHEMMVFGLHDGQYQVVLADVQYERNTRIRMSDAVLLSMISDIPLYMEASLFRQQSVLFNENDQGVSIPINTMDVPRLNMAMQHAINEENYELASKLRDEIKRRTVKG